MREELRAGRIDPFDMASREGSSIKRPLVEVDEIFQNSRVQMGELVNPKSAEVFSRKLENATIMSTEVQSQKVAVNQDLPSMPVEAPRPRQFQALAAADKVNHGRGKSSGRRRYIVMDSVGRMRGPLTSAEVIDLWNGGHLDSQSIVRRDGGTRTIPIRRFMQLYEESHSSGVAFLSSFTTRVPQFIFVKKSASERILIWLGILAMMGALAFLGRMFWLTRQSHLKKSVGVSAPLQRFDLKANEHLAGRRLTKGNQPTPSAAVDSPKATKLTLPSKKVDAREIKPQSPKRQPKAVRAPRYKSTVRPSSFEYRQGPSQRARSNYNKPLYSSPQRASAPVYRASVPPPAPVAKPAFSEGTTVTLSGYRYTKGGLDACSGKCKLVVSGPRGNVTAVFFKEAFGSVLSRKTQGLSLTGIIRGSASTGWQLIVSDVK